VSGWRSEFHDPQLSADTLTEVTLQNQQLEYIHTYDVLKYVNNRIERII
jgi:hypothetical protein